MRREALILGGGPAGAAVAIALARDGARATVLERTRETGDALCGGFLSWRTLETLAGLGVHADVLNHARVRRVTLFAGEVTALAHLPRPALAVSRHRLDTVLLERATAAGAGIERGVTVREVNARTLRTGNGDLAIADALFLASGKHDVRGAARPADARGHDPAVGLRLRLPVTAALDRLVADAIELHLFRGGYAGLVRQEDGGANLCLAVRRSRLAEAEGNPHRLLQELAREQPHLAERLARADLGAHVDAVANVPYGWRARETTPGRFRLGDQAAVIPSLAGEGIGIALASAVSAACAFAAGEAAPQWQQVFARAAATPVTLASLAWHLAERPWAAAPLVRALAWRPRLIDFMARATRITQDRTTTGGRTHQWNS